MSKRIDHALDVCARFQFFVDVRLAVDPVLSEDEVQALFRMACQDVAAEQHVRFQTIWSQMTREMGLSGGKLYQLLLDHLTADDPAYSKLAHMLCGHSCRDDSSAYIRERLRQI